MAFQRYPLTSVQKVSQLIRDALVLPTMEHQATRLAAPAADEWQPNSLDALGELFRVGDIPEDNLPAPNAEGRWFVSTTDPAGALAKVPSLWLSPGIRLVTYLRQDSTGGQGATVALPGLLSSTERLEAAIEAIADPEAVPMPEGALPNLMAGLDGDGSLGSFLAASIILREIREFGRFGRYARWAHHRVIDAVPTQVPWQWRTKQPEDWAPKVVLRPEAEVIVEFYSCRVQKPIALFRHFDRYPPHCYTATNQDQVIAVAAPPRPNRQV